MGLLDGVLAGLVGGTGSAASSAADSLQRKMDADKKAKDDDLEQGRRWALEKYRHENDMDKQAVDHRFQVQLHAADIEARAADAKANRQSNESIHRENREAMKGKQDEVESRLRSAEKIAEMRDLTNELVAIRKDINPENHENDARKAEIIARLRELNGQNADDMAKALLDKKLKANGSNRGMLQTGATGSF